MAEPSGSYDASQLQVLEGLEAVRKRPHMYIGSTDSRGLIHLLWEIADNSVDEALGGHASDIEVTLHPNGSIEVVDDGRGIPVDVNEKSGMPGVILVLTNLHAGGKFGGDSGYKVAGGLHGVGSSVVNALSSRMEVTVWRDGVEHRIDFQRGVAGHFEGKKFTPSLELKTSPAKPKKRTGTRVRYWADIDLFTDDAHVAIDKVVERARQTAFLVPGLNMRVCDRRAADADEHVDESFCFEGGSADFVEYLAEGELVSPILTFRGEDTYTERVRVSDGDTVETREVERVCEVDTSMCWADGYDANVKSFVNIVTTPKGGRHVEGFESAVAKAVRDAIEDHAILTKKEREDEKATILKDDVFEGVVAVVMVRMPEPGFEGQTKEALGTPAARTIVYQVVKDQLTEWLLAPKNKQKARTVTKKVSDAMRARLAARKQRETVRRKQALESSSLPGKLADCRSHDLEKSEIMLVEGDSAMGCFVGTTQVATVEGRPYSFEELASDWDRGVTHFGYASDEAGDVVVVPLVHPRRTKTASALVAVTLDSGEVAQCTPDHLWRLRDGSYCRADQLGVGDSLMPLYRQLTRDTDLRGPGHEMVWANSRSRWEHTNDTFAAMDALASEWALVGAAPNHKVAAVHTMSAEEDVYDLTVDDHHNFALEAGVFVHNSAKMARESEFQALLPLRGKILNTLQATESRMLDNRECQAIVTAMGAGSGKTFDPDAIRYGKIILLVDADVDGSHIRCLLLTLIHEYMRPLLEEGRVFAAQPPLYKIETAGSGGKKGEVYYMYTDEEREKVLRQIEKKGQKVKITQRYKGLGEMNPDQLAETTLDKGTRILRRITIDDAEAAREIFEITMGKAVPPRKEFIEQMSAKVDEGLLDV